MTAVLLNTPHHLGVNPPAREKVGVTEPVKKATSEGIKAARACIIAANTVTSKPLVDQTIPDGLAALTLVGDAVSAPATAASLAQDIRDKKVVHAIAGSFGLLYLATKVVQVIKKFFSMQMGAVSAFVTPVALGTGFFSTVFGIASNGIDADKARKKVDKLRGKIHALTTDDAATLDRGAVAQEAPRSLEVSKSAANKKLTSKVLTIMSKIAKLAMCVIGILAVFFSIAMLPAVGALVAAGLSTLALSTAIAASVISEQSKAKEKEGKALELYEARQTIAANEPAASA